MIWRIRVIILMQENGWKNYSIFTTQFSNENIKHIPFFYIATSHNPCATGLPLY